MRAAARGAHNGAREGGRRFDIGGFTWWCGLNIVVGVNVGQARVVVEA